MLSYQRRRILRLVSCTAAPALMRYSKILAAQEDVCFARSGPLNLITDVPGLRVGSAHDALVRTGTTVILGDAPMLAAVDVRGGAPATREIDALGEDKLVQHVDAVVFSGGSVYGLAAADGVTTWLGQRQRGFALRPARNKPVSPIVPAACLYDLANGGDKLWQDRPPYRQLGIDALCNASDTFQLGTAGAGYGALTNNGTVKGGLGSASVVARCGAVIGAIVAVNSLGSVVAAGTRAFWATPWEIGNEFGGAGAHALAQLRGAPEDWLTPAPQLGRYNTTLACVATDLALTRVELKRVASMAHDGMARAIRPVHSAFDGDIVIATSTNRRSIPMNGQVERETAVLNIGALAADTLARAIARAIFEAKAWPNSPARAWRDIG